MNLYGLAKRISEDPCLESLLAQKETEAEGFYGGSAAAFFSALYLRIDKPLFIISRNAMSLANDMKLFLGGDQVSYFPAWDTYPSEDISPSKEIVGERMKLLDKLSRNERQVVIANIRAAVTSVIPKDVLKKHTLNLRSGSAQIKRDELIKMLINIGFKRRDIVGERGEFSVKGSIVDIFSPNHEGPVRVEYAIDTIESIRLFDAVNQRSVSNIPEARILPLYELVLENDDEYKDGVELKIPLLYPEFQSIFDHIADAKIVMDDPQNIKLAFEKFIREVEELRGRASGKYYLDYNEFEGLAHSGPAIESVKGSRDILLGFSSAEDYFGKLDGLLRQLTGSREENSIFIVSKQDDRIYELLIENGLAAQKIESVPPDFRKGIHVLFGQLESGFKCKDIVVLTDKEIFGEVRQKIRFTPKPSEGVSEKLLAKLTLGDFVVHSNYGIGIYRGLASLTIGGALQEYIQIDYADEDKLYVPLHQMGFVERYSAGGDHKPKIGRLGSAEWAKVKSRAKKSIKDLTQELLNIYTSRLSHEGHRYPSNSLLEMDFEKSFQYEETLDQVKAIGEIKKDMGNGKLMDRLVCGDVGYGKTEVALRAAFKTVLAGQQVAVLTPTTILADQHFRTFSQRFKPYPITVEMLSRFRTKEEQKQTVKNLKIGVVDVVIGTHRLIQKDVVFKNLGLIIVDEEQKFGVMHKEKLKQIAKGVNVITLTATPIPRTLYMALSGVREMSIIATPPLDRSPVRTYLREWDENVIKEAIRRELDRGGQVFFVHNYVRSIDKIAGLIQGIVPEARIAVAHGQMKETQLEDIMIKFINKEYDVLVSTSIIESGLDIPSVNTVIIDHAEDFGLSQLYQIRGRVGRSSTRAFAYLLYHKGTVLTDKALERLKAIQEFTALGSGYKLAMADLEIRGSGNILGAQQHGHLLNIGFDMYCDLIEESVRELKSIETPAAKKVLIDLKIDAYIPKDYVPDDKQRIALYRRMNFLNEQKELEDLRKEMEDRFGRIPPEFTSLFKMIRLKIDAGHKGVTSIIGGSERIEIRYEHGSPFLIRTKDMSKDEWFTLVQGHIKRLPAIS